MSAEIVNANASATATASAKVKKVTLSAKYTKFLVFGHLLINQLISVSMERKLLNQLHVFDFVPGDQRIVVERLGEMDKHIARIKSVIQSHTELLPTMTESELSQFTRRVQVEGELKAMEWLVTQRQAER
jgi:hypothetical protein